MKVFATIIIAMSLASTALAVREDKKEPREPQEKPAKVCTPCPEKQCPAPEPTKKDRHQTHHDKKSER